MPSSLVVSVCIPVYNAEQYVGSALDCVLGQTYEQIEVIAVNDGSTDRSREVLARYAGRIRVIDQENRGQCAAANKAFLASTGDLIKFFDADDVMAPDMIQKQVACLGERRDAIALGEWSRFYGSEPNDKPFAKRPMYRNSDPTDWLVKEWATSQPMMQCALWLIPRQIIGRAGLWDERLTLINDFEFFARVLLNCTEILFSPGARLHYRSGLSDSLSGQKSRKAVESQLLSLMLGTGHLLDVRKDEAARRACANMLQQFVYEHYPAHSDLRAKAQAQLLELGGADIAPIGPPNFHRLRRVFGWKAARRVQRAMSR